MCVCSTSINFYLFIAVVCALLFMFIITVLLKVEESTNVACVFHFCYCGCCGANCDGVV